MARWNEAGWLKTTKKWLPSNGLNFGAEVSQKIRRRKMTDRDDPRIDCPDCDGYGYHEPDLDICLTCDGDGVVLPEKMERSDEKLPD